LPLGDPTACRCSAPRGSAKEHGYTGTDHITSGNDKSEFWPAKLDFFNSRFIAFVFAIAKSDDSPTKKVLEKRMIPKESNIEVDTIFTIDGATPYDLGANRKRDSEPETYRENRTLQMARSCRGG
jgi:hypothetical protein